MSKDDKEKILKHINSHKAFGVERTCPFSIFYGAGVNWIRHESCINKFCGIVFPGWRSAYKKAEEWIGCPCSVIDVNYVVKRFNEWLKEV